MKSLLILVVLVLIAAPIESASVGGPDPLYTFLKLGGSVTIEDGTIEYVHPHLGHIEYECEPDQVEKVLRRRAYSSLGIMQHK